MNLNNFLNRELFNLEHIVNELYDMTKPGIVAVENALTPAFCDSAIKDFKRKTYLFKEAPRIEGETYQELKTFYYGSADGGEQDYGQFPLVSNLKEAYSEIYKQIGKRCKFWQGSVINSQGIHWYPSDSCGMGVHRDYSNDINLLSLFILSGDASFSVYDNKKRNKQIYNITTLPGMWIGMRGPRSPIENEYRPFHEIGTITNERFSIIFRQKSRNHIASSLRIRSSRSG